jgi:hypothetical protein
VRTRNSFLLLAILAALIGLGRGQDALKETVAKVRQDLQSNPTWKALADSKQNIRVEKEAVIADDLVR